MPLYNEMPTSTLKWQIKYYKLVGTTSAVANIAVADVVDADVEVPDVEVATFGCCGCCCTY